MKTVNTFHLEKAPYQELHLIDIKQRTSVPFHQLLIAQPPLLQSRQVSQVSADWYGMKTELAG